MPLSKKFSDGIGDLSSIPKLDPAVAKSFPNAMAYAGAADDLDSLKKLLEKAHADAVKEIGAYNKLVEKLEKAEDTIDKNGAVYDKALKAYVKKGRDYPQKAYQTGCEGIADGMAEIDKALIELKNKFPEIKIK